MRVDLFSASELLYWNLINRLQLIRARPNFLIISDNPNVSLETVDFSIYTRRIALKDDYHKKRIYILVYTPVEFNYLETLANTLIFPARQNRFNHENIFNMAPVRPISLQWTQTRHSLDFTPKIYPCNISLVSDKLEYSKEVNQS